MRGRYKNHLNNWVNKINKETAFSRPKESDSNVFLETCLRCGRILQEQGFQKWRWTGFNFGLDLILITDARTLSIKRHHRTEYERLLSMQTKRQLLLR